MKEIIVKRDGTCITMLEIVDNILRLNIEDHECNYNMDFTLEEIDDLQEAISIMKDRLERNLSNKADNFNCEIVSAPDFSLIAELTGGKLLIESIKNDSDNVVIKGKIQKNDTPTEQKDEENVSNNEQIVEEKSTYGGEIADFPIEIVEKMLERQVEQGYARDVSVFEKYKCSGGLSYGFAWYDTNDGKDFWNDVINNKNFALFFERYPKKQE